jgi:hypothetical protein
LSATFAGAFGLVVTLFLLTSSVPMAVI